MITASFHAATLLHTHSSTITSYFLIGNQDLMDSSIQNIHHAFSFWGAGFSSSPCLLFVFICLAAAHSWFYRKQSKLAVMLQWVSVGWVHSFESLEVGKSHFLDVSAVLPQKLTKGKHVMGSNLLLAIFLWIVLRKKNALKIKTTPMW